MILLVDGVWNTLKFQLAEGACNQEHTLETSFASLKMDDDKEELKIIMKNRPEFTSGSKWGSCSSFCPITLIHVL
jgi:hypothetical protein